MKQVEVIHQGATGETVVRTFDADSWSIREGICMVFNGTTEIFAVLTGRLVSVETKEAK